MMRCGRCFRFHPEHVDCDWYLELAKPLLSARTVDAKQGDASRRSLGARRDLKMLHPSPTPLITEELMAGGRPQGRSRPEGTSLGVG